MADRPTMHWQKCGDIDILMMGVVAVGRVHPSPPRWIFNLGAPACFWVREKTEGAARTALLLSLDDWLHRAGIIHKNIDEVSDDD